ncbi:MAG: hypothetical protein AAGN64_08695 [Bacteroidota bacterium]
MLHPEKAKATIRHVVGLLASRNYEALAQLSTDGLSANALRRCVEEYGRTIVAEPFEAWEPMRFGDGPEWWVDVDLHTVEGGRSDLTLQLILNDTPGAFCDVQIHDLHVL